MFVTTASIGDTILSALWGFLLTIDGLIYNLICYVTEIFNSLVKLNVFTNEGYNDIVSRIYIVLGLIMLFVLAYSLLKAIINPENFSKGETSFSKLIGNTVSSLIIIAILPTVFSVAFNIQNSLVNQGTIYKIILGNDNNDSSSTDEIKDGGRDIAYYTFTSFFYENDQSDGENTDSSENSYDGIATAVRDNGDSFTKFSTFSEKVVDKSITYMFPVSTIAGIVILYILLNFCFDVAVRVVKLAFYQIIAPIPVMCRIIPGGKMKDVFSKWLKQVISLFVEVFIRMAAIAFGVKFVQIIVDNKDSLNIDASTGARRIVTALLIMAVVIFIKQIPKIIGDMFGIDTAGMKLGLMDKLAMGGALTAGSVAGGALGMLGRNAVSAVKNFNKTKGKKPGERAKALAFGAASIAAGTFSGAARGFNRGKGAKNFADMRKAAGGAVTAATAAKAKRDAYRANYKNTHPGKGAVQGLFGIAGSHILDAAARAGEYFGIGNNLDALKKERDLIGQITAIDDNTDKVSLELLDRDAFSASDALMAAASHNTYNMSYAAMKERMQQLRNTSFNSVRGKELTDFRGRKFQINDENIFARFAATMSSQLNEAERNANSYIKAQGYLGANGVSNLNALGITLGGGDMQRMEKLFSDRTKIAEFVRDNQDFIAGLNSNVADPDQRIDAISDGKVAGITGAWAQMDQLVTNAKNRNITIDAEFARMTREAAQRNGGSNSN